MFDYNISTGSDHAFIIVNDVVLFDQTKLIIIITKAIFIK